MPSFYYAPQSVPAFDLSPTQILPESIQVYQPVTLKVALTKPDGTPWVGTANITVIAGSGGTTLPVQQRELHGGRHCLRDHDARPERRAAASEHRLLRHRAGLGLQRRDGAAPIVPANGIYPATSAADLWYTFTEKMVPIVMGTLDVTVDADQLQRHGTFRSRAGSGRRRSSVLRRATNTLRSASGTTGADELAVRRPADRCRRAPGVHRCRRRAAAARPSARANADGSASGEPRR